MRLISAKLSLENTFDVTEGFAVRVNPFPHIAVGLPNPAKQFTRIPVGNRFAERLMRERPCPNDGNATIGVCRECRKTITAGDIRKVKSMVGHIEVFNPVADHDKVRWINPILYGSLILTKEKGTLMLVEERHTDRKDRAALHISAEGTNVMIVIAPRGEDEYKVIHEKAVGQRWVRGKHVGTDRIFILKQGDRIAIARTIGEYEERMFIEVDHNLSPVLVSATRDAVIDDEPEDETPTTDFPNQEVSDVEEESLPETDMTPEQAPSVEPMPSTPAGETA